MLRGLLALTLLIPACKDETVAGYAPEGVVFFLQEIDGEAFGARATLVLAPGGGVSGDAPCNSYTGRQGLPLPWFEVIELAVTRRACAELQAEAAFLASLQAMSLAEVAGDVLILSNDAGREMVFREE